MNLSRGEIVVSSATEEKFRSCLLRHIEGTTHEELYRETNFASGTMIKCLDELHEYYYENNGKLYPNLNAVAVEQEELDMEKIKSGYFVVPFKDSLGSVSSSGSIAIASPISTVGAGDEGFIKEKIKEIDAILNQITDKLDADSIRIILDSRKKSNTAEAGTKIEI